MTKTQHDAIKTFSHAIVQPTKEDQASLPHNTCLPSSLPWTFKALFNRSDLCKKQADLLLKTCYYFQEGKNVLQIFLYGMIPYYEYKKTPKAYFAMSNLLAHSKLCNNLKKTSS